MITDRQLARMLYQAYLEVEPEYASRKRGYSFKAYDEIPTMERGMLEDIARVTLRMMNEEVRNAKHIAIPVYNAPGGMKRAVMTRDTYKEVKKILEALQAETEVSITFREEG